jgi:nucleotide-binding universal stress UspA family protein
MIRNIVVPLDGSELAQAALPTAVALARASNASLHLIRVHLPALYAELPNVGQLDTFLREQEQRFLDETVSQLRRESAVQVDASLEDAPVASAITHRAAEIKSDLIVMTTHGYTGMSRVWLGSVADGVVRRSETPVLLLRPEGGSSATTEPPPLFKNILIPLDGSEQAESILPHAISLGALGGASYTLVRVVKPFRIPIHPYSFYAIPVEDDRAAQEEAVKHATGYLDGIASQVRTLAPGAQVRTEVLLHDHPAAAIVDKIQGGSADLVALTTTGHGLARLALGSVADKLLRAVHLPVLLYRPA